MFKTDDNYNLYYDGVISQDQEAKFRKLIQDYQLQPNLVDLVKRHHNLRVSNSFDSHRILLWSLYEVLKSYAITIFFAEVEHPSGCEYQSRVDFFVDIGARFDYELKNSLYIYGDYDPSDECKERIKQKSIGFDQDCRVKGNIDGMDSDTFVNSITLSRQQRENTWEVLKNS
jgi:hypothetical protein